MKKLLYTICALILSTFSINAQNYTPSAGDWALSTNAHSLLDYAGNLFISTANSPEVDFTDDKTFVIPRDKIMVITQADQHISHYYEVILDRLSKAKEKMKPALSAEEMEKIYRLADQMDQMQQVDKRESAWTEQDLIDLFGKKTIH